jgi:hypothetical protein
MSLDREAIVATAERAYALVWRALAAEIPGAVPPSAVGRGVMQQISAARVDLHVIEEVLGSLRSASGSHA